MCPDSTINNSWYSCRDCQLGNIEISQERDWDVTYRLEVWCWKGFWTVFFWTGSLIVLTVDGKSLLWPFYKRPSVIWRQQKCGTLEQCLWHSSIWYKQLQDLLWNKMFHRLYVWCRISLPDLAISDSFSLAKKLIFFSNG